MTMIKIVQITYDSDADEYRVPGPHKRREEAGAYYTSDIQDAVSTAFQMYAKLGPGNVEVRIPKGMKHERRLYPNG